MVDEVGQYVARDSDRMFELMGLAHAIQKKRGALWVAATSQEKLEDVVDSLEGKRVELARAQDRFPVRVDLVPSDIEEVAGRRVLEKNAEGREAARNVLRPSRHKFASNAQLESPTRSQDFSEEEFIRLYPLLPYQIQLFIDAVSAHRARGGAGAMLGGSNRTIIKLAQQLVIHTKTRLGEKEVGALATLDMAYDLLESIIPTAWQAEIDQVAARHGEWGLPTRVAKAIALVSGVPALPLHAANIAVMLHERVDAESLRASVAEALEGLLKEEVVRQTEAGYKLQSPEEKSWEKERRGIDMRPAAYAEIKREAIRELLAGLVASRDSRAFKVEVRVGDQRVLGMEVAARQFRRVKGYREIPILIAALGAHAGRVSEGDARVA
ncbi:MAG: hypothetical protein ACRDIF_04820 [Actinomycetota bacterium]